MTHLLIPMEPYFNPESNQLGPSWGLDNDGLVYLRCECGIILGGLRNHTIDEDGTVNVSVLHDKDLKGPHECNWHTHVKLDKWSDGAQPRGVGKFAPSKVQR